MFVWVQLCVHMCLALSNSKHKKTLSACEMLKVTNILLNTAESIDK